MFFDIGVRYRCAKASVVQRWLYLPRWKYKRSLKMVFHRCTVVFYWKWESIAGVRLNVEQRRRVSLGVTIKWRAWGWTAVWCRWTVRRRKITTRQWPRSVSTMILWTLPRISVDRNCRPSRRPVFCWNLRRWERGNVQHDCSERTTWSWRSSVALLYSSLAICAAERLRSTRTQPRLTNLGNTVLEDEISCYVYTCR